MRIKRLVLIVAFIMASSLVATFAANAQNIPTPQLSQAASVSQSIGLVKVTVDYHSPAVTLNGVNRRGKIWGALVPYGLQPTLGYGTCTQCPWRGGANENTTFTTSHDIRVEGQPLPAGTYGLHFIPDPNEWTVIFSKNSTSWGSFFYDPSEDALRVKTKPVAAPYHEYLTYDFSDRGVDKATLALTWEELSVPIHLTVPNSNEIFLAEMRKTIHGGGSDNWRNWLGAAQFALANKMATKEALQWAQTAVNGTFIGEKNFTTLMTLAQAQEANGLGSDAAKTRQEALNLPNASVMELHQYGRQLIGAGKNDDALKVFQLNAQRHPNEWPVNLGLARGYRAVGNRAEALKYAKLALPQAPDAASRKALETMISELEAGK